MNDAQAEALIKALADMNRQLSDLRKGQARLESLVVELRSREAVVTVPHDGVVR